jgi:hypothetical protein
VPFLILLSYRHDGLRFDTRKLAFSLDWARLPAHLRIGEIEAIAPLIHAHGHNLLPSALTMNQVHQI